MGITGTDVTKEVSDMIITDDNFASIVALSKKGEQFMIISKNLFTIFFPAILAEIIGLCFSLLWLAGRYASSYPDSLGQFSH